ncbi:hypothetical protein H696_05990 [Fonticula alba]|uniref:Uncharacterized protein n=1 Tax=Fonticula alba TaxID=691883 RepID=A0A058Z0E1_FONAL|nr:hypothetical protein H696_05990 [Fonticula alba]KCV67591.1 hypothetical protein H696_05990 [Fonticula alba]|eukprot:XP_009498032.1 hypothetical protein H696_05990 [Fonticula alba]
MLKAALLLAILAILSVAATAAPMDQLLLAEEELSALVDSASHPCIRPLQDFAQQISGSRRCDRSALNSAASYGKCTVEKANKFDGKTIKDLTTAFEDCSTMVTKHRDWCRKHEPDSQAAKADLSNYKCPTRYQTESKNKSFPKKGCDNMALDKLDARFRKHCIQGGFAGVTLDSLCNKKKCIDTLVAIHECTMDRYSSPHSVCQLLHNTYSFEVFCPQDTAGHKAFSKIDCEPQYAWDEDKDFVKIEK